ncbi:MAG: hypothetical protein EA370_06825 [Wenzhouxiangella sp.]|nr:MAG: hypothetical protein EA370_06825 [Wenzhouxiangella sp.]
MNDPGGLERRFQDLCDLEPDEQARALQKLERDDPELAKRLSLLLEAHRRPDALLDDKALQRWAAMLKAFDARALVGSSIGDYRLRELVGQGGMSAVYRAVRRFEGVERTVALKVLALPVVDERTALRFMNEAGILARLDHPAIARLLDWGRTEQGWPFLALELVQGEMIDAWCRQRGISLAARLELMEQVASAVAYAHSNLVVHLDLKPGNVLINQHGQPVVLDFGIAQVVADNIAGAETTVPRWLTPGYASPELIAGKPGSVASDIYMMGVMLYELITDRRPFDFDQASPAESIDLIERGPVPPSRLNRALPRDLDAVCRKALHPEPERRYGSAESFAADIAAVRENRPVRALPASLGYRMRKALQRHPITIPGTALASIAIMVLLAVLWLQSGDLRSQRDLAETERERAEEVTRFLVDSIGAVSPQTLSEAGAGLSELMESTVERLALNPPSDAHLRAALLEQIARTRLAMGEHEPALQAAELGLQANPDGVTRARLLGLQAGALRNLARYDEALAAADQAVTAADGLKLEILFENRRRRLQTLERMTRFDEAEAYGRETLAMLAEDQRLLRAHGLNDLATVGLARMDMAGVEAHAGEALEIYREIHQEPHVDTSEAAWRLAVALLNTGRSDEALPLLDEALALRTQLYGADDHRVGEIHYVYSHAVARLGRHDEAVDHARAAYDNYVESLPGNDPRLMAATGSVGTALKDIGQVEESIGWFQRAIGLGEIIHGDPFHPDLGAFHNQLAEVHIHRGEYAEALAINERLLPMFIELAGEPSVPTTFIRHNISRSLRGLGRAEEALVHAEGAASQAAAIYSPDHFMTAGVQAEVGQCLLALGRIAEAAEIAQRLQAVMSASAAPIPSAQQSAMDDFLGASQLILAR